MSDDKSKVQVVETLKLEKFDGDDQTQEPVETIEILTINGIEISRKVTRKEEGNAAN
jgi:hypothetical protein